MFTLRIFRQKNHRRRCGFEMKKIIVERERKIRRRKKKKEEKRTIFQGFLRASVEGRCQGQGRRQGQGLGVPILVEWRTRRPTPPCRKPPPGIDPFSLGKLDQSWLTLHGNQPVSDTFSGNLERERESMSI